MDHRPNVLRAQTFCVRHRTVGDGESFLPLPAAHASFTPRRSEEAAHGGERCENRWQQLYARWSAQRGGLATGSDVDAFPVIAVEYTGNP